MTTPPVLTSTPAPVSPPPENEESESPETWDDVLKSLPEGRQKLYDGQVQTLLNTVRNTREERDGFKRQLKSLSKSAEEGSDLQKQLDLMTTDLEAADRRAAFMEEAIKPNVQCKNPRAAFLMAEAESLFDKKGNPDWFAIKEAAPELFGAIVGNANAATGTNPNDGQSGMSSSRSMNAFIRNAAGRK